MAARRVAASGLRHFAPPSARRRGFVVGDTAPTAAFTRPPLLLPHALSSSGSPQVLRRGFAVIPDDGGRHSLESDDAEVSPGFFDPESLDDPETCFAHDEKDLESDETMWAMYERWCVFHDMKRDREDMLRRFSLFKERARYIHEFNMSGEPWTMGLNRFSDLTQEERTRMFPPKLWRPLANRCSACCMETESKHH